MNKREKAKLMTSQKKWQIILEVKQLKKKGYNHSEISRKLKLCRPTVMRYLSLDAPPICATYCILDPWMPRIKELIQGGYKYTDIYAKIKNEGYSGQISLYKSKMKGIRQELKQNIKYIKRSKIRGLLYHPLSEMKDEILKLDIENYLEHNRELREILELVEIFKSMVLTKEIDKLSGWLQKAEEYNIIELNQFIK